MKFIVTSAIALIPPIICLALLGVSIYPGGVENAIILFILLVLVALNLFISNLIAGQLWAILTFVLLGGIPILMLWREVRQSATNNSPSSSHRLPVRLRKILRWLWILDGCIVGLTIVLLSANIPLKWSFSQVEPSFSDLAAQASTPGAIAFVDRQFGPYSVSEMVQSEAGGTYIRLRSPEFFVSDRTIYGFAHHPNPNGSPFGGGDENHRHYEVHSIDGEWHWFQDNFGTDDWRSF
ncbi:hypothetical protein [Vacuolonema iberomarrocanum]|uniref:hypothetical protein n=1 Tax=Vacuolonema iberomarrocanum TaxID=3454632 RepID=UPI0019F06FD1|nr:hypothetical protein [filamentous cyanobacterium LEGE 07170]